MTSIKKELKTNKLRKKRILFLSPAVRSGREREQVIKDFKIIKKLGNGAFGDVYKC